MLQLRKVHELATKLFGPAPSQAFDYERLQAEMLRAWPPSQRAIEYGRWSDKQRSQRLEQVERELEKALVVVTYYQQIRNDLVRGHQLAAPIPSRMVPRYMF